MRLELLSLDFRRPYAGQPVRLDPRRPAPRPEWAGAEGGGPVLLARRHEPLVFEARVRLEAAGPRRVSLRARPEEERPLLGEGVGEVVRLRPGEIATIQLRFESHALAEQPVGRRELALRWSARDGHGEPVEVRPRRTVHEAFTVLAQPAEPWDRDERALDAPWASALALATRWAEGAESAEEAARAITAALWALGQQGDPAERFAYDVDGVRGYVTRAGGGFPLAGFQERVGWLAEGADPPEPDPAGGYVECRDLAAALTVLANLIGCELKIGRIDHVHQGPDRGFYLRPFVLFGGLDQPWGFYDFHEVAIDPHGRIFDACLQVCAPGSAAPELPQGMSTSRYLEALVDRGRSEAEVGLVATHLRALHVGEVIHLAQGEGYRSGGAGPSSRLRVPNRPFRPRVA